MEPNDTTLPPDIPIEDSFPAVVPTAVVPEAIGDNPDLGAAIEFSVDELAAEANDTILTANDLSSPATIFGEIGDNPALPATDDVDLFAVQLNAGDILLVDINAVENLDVDEISGLPADTALTIFDANGILLAQNEDNSYDIEVGPIVTRTDEPDPFQEFIAPQDGTYYVGVSSTGNLDYDPNVAGSGTGESSGIYSLVLSLGEPDDDITPSIETEVI